MATLNNLTNTPEPKDDCDTKPSDDCSKDPGEALAKFDFSRIDLSSQGPDHSDAHAALASMSSDDALDYAIGQMGRRITSTEGISTWRRTRRTTRTPEAPKRLAMAVNAAGRELFMSGTR